MTSAPTGAAGSAFSALEHETAVFMRRARGASGALARDVHPDLDAAAYGLLVRIEESGAARVTDLAEYFSVGKPTVSRQVALLERLALVHRLHDDRDARSSPIGLTERGRALLTRTRAARLESIRARLADWAMPDVAALARLLAAFNASTGP